MLTPQSRLSIAAIAAVVSLVAARGSNAQPLPLPPPFPISPYDVGSALRLQVTPNDAEVFLDGYLVGQVDDFDGFFQRLRVRPGEHEIGLYHEGFHSVRQKIFLSAGATFKVQYNLQPLKPGDTADARPVPLTPPEAMPRPGRRDRDRDREHQEAAGEAGGFGSIAIRVQPDGAEIVIDGERWQPAASGERLIVQLPEGRRHVEIRMPGRHTFSQDVEVHAGQTVTLNVSLREE